MLREAGYGPGGAGGGAGLFGGPPAGANASANATGAGSAPFNPSQWPPFPQPTQPAAAGATGTGTAAGAAGQPGAGLVDPALIQQLLGGLGSGTPGGGLPGLGSLGGSPPAQPADTRSPEERFQVQLQQLQEMGFTNATQNVRALLATGGNVHSAIEYILSGGGL